MNLPNELWYTVFSFLTHKSQSKFSCLWNLHNLSTEEIELMYSSINLWFDTARNGYIKLMKLLIKTGSTDLNKRDASCRIALHSANVYGHKDCIEFLIKAGADLNKQDIYGYTSLHEASIHGHKDCVELLIKAGAILDIQSNFGYTALHCASIHNHKEIIELLIQSGVNVSIQTNDGCTALVFAIRCDHKEIIELLEKTD